MSSDSKVKDAGQDGSHTNLDDELWVPNPPRSSVKGPWLILDRVLIGMYRTLSQLQKERAERPGTARFQSHVFERLAFDSGGQSEESLSGTWPTRLASSLE